MKEIFRRRPKYLSLPERTNGASLRVPDNMWISCPHCHELLYAKEYEDNFKVCSKCKHHFRLSVEERLTLILDEGSFEERDRGLSSADPLHFVAGDYSLAAKLDDDQRKHGSREGVLYGTGAIEGLEVAIAIHNFKVRGGSMGVAEGEKIARAIELSIALKCPLVIVSATGGARQEEGVYSLMQMAKTVAALDHLKSERLPYISLLTDPTTAGVLASYAFLGDINMAEPGAFIGFAGPRVIEQATKQKLPTDANTAEFMLQHGMIDMIVPRAELRTTLATTLRLLSARTYSPSPGAGHAALRLAAAGVRENGNGHHG